MKPLHTEIPFATPWFQVAAKTMEEGAAPFYSLRLPDYAATVALTEDDRVVLVRQYRPAVERETLELPSGLVDAGEDPLTAARRELYEETGYDAPGIELLRSMWPDTGRLGNRIWFCAARGVRKLPGWAPEIGVTVELMTITELAAATREGQFDHALHAAALMTAVLHGKLRFD